MSNHLLFSTVEFLNLVNNERLHTVLLEIEHVVEALSHGLSRIACVLIVGHMHAFGEQTLHYEGPTRHALIELFKLLSRADRHQRAVSSIRDTITLHLDRRTVYARF